MAPHMTETPLSPTTTPDISITTKPITGLSARLASRSNTLTTPTCGLSAPHIQANILILPSRHASDFRSLCARNPVPCPLLAESAHIGSYSHLKSYIPSVSDNALASDLDLRTDIPRFNVYCDGVLVKREVLDVLDEWTGDHIAFLIGCSFSFERALCDAGLVPRQILMGRNVPMYRTKVPLCPAGVFAKSTVVVSMRPYRRDEIETVRRVTKRYGLTHGEPIAWGWDAVRALGIENLDVPEWGDAPVTAEGRPLGEVEDDEDNVPVFWGCGVTPQEAVMRAGLEGTVMAHAPGHMLVLDVKDWDVVTT